MADDILPVQVGSITCTVIHEESSEPTLETMHNRFPSIDPDLMAAAFSARHPGGSCDFSMNTLLIQTGKHTVLIDTGSGEGRTNPCVRSLVDPAAVGTVVISHGHGDHIGGLIDAEGKLVYPNARYLMHADEWNQWMGPGGEAQANPERAAFFEARLGPIQENLLLIEGETEVVPGVTAIPAVGHTRGHLAFWIESEGQRLFDLVDAMHFSVQLDHPDWSPRYDSDPAQAAKTRREVFNRAADEKVLTLLYHFPFPGLGYVVRRGDTFDWEPV